MGGAREKDFELMETTTVALSLALSVASPLGANEPPANLPYHTPSGTLSLRVDAAVVAVEARDLNALRPVFEKHPGLRATRLFHADQVIVEGAPDPGAVRRELVGAGARALVAYRTSRGALLISDGTIALRVGSLVDGKELEAWSVAAGASQIEQVDRRRGLYRVFAAPEMAVSVADALHKHGRVRWAHPDFIYRVRQHFSPNDEFYAQQWHHAFIGAEGGWELHRGASSVKIAILDSGVDMQHPDLAAKLVDPRDTESQDSDPTPDYAEAHGTACAGLAAAVSHNGTGIAGVCHNCSIIPIRIFPGSGFARFGADADGILWASDKGAAVISNSWGPAEPSPTPFNLDFAIQTATEEGRGGLGAVVLIAAGNDGRENESYEVASHPLVLGIGATSWNDTRETYSNYGAELDLVAPAGSVTTDNRGNGGYVSGDYMSSFGGTSAATPVVAGVVGLIVSANPTLTRGQIHSLLFETADKIGGVAYPGGKNTFYGYGRVNALRALQGASGDAICQPLTENCSNGIDDDCDFLVDSDDPNCAPGPGESCGAPTYQCQQGSVCIAEDQSGTTNSCYRVCESAAECSGEEQCVPLSNDMSVCLEGGTGTCPPCGDLTCDEDSLCLSLEEPPLTLCAPDCVDNTDCPTGFYCAPLSGGGGACVPLSFSCSVWGPGPGDACQDDSCALGNICLGDGFCYAACESSTECAEGESCQATTSAGINFCDCACDATGACDAGCSCDRDCQTSCQCNSSSACDPGCPCDPDCDSACDCDINAEVCDVGCGCDNTCVCTCDASTGCDADCACDTDCIELCACDATTACDPDCTCDPECRCDCDLTTACDSNCACDPECGDGGICVAAIPPQSTGTENPAGFGWVLALFAVLGLAATSARLRRRNRSRDSI